MVKTKKNNIKAGMFSTMICFACAIILLCGALGMGALNMILKDEFYNDVTTDSLSGVGIIEFVKLNIDSVSVIMGIFVFVAVSMIFCLILKAADKQESVIKAGIVGVVISLVLRLAAGLLWPIEPESDFFATYDLAQLLNTIPIGYWGRFLPELGTPYTGMWAANLPFVLYEAVVIKSGISLTVLNAVYGSATCIFASLIAKDIFGKKAFMNVLAFTALNPLLILYTSVLSNQHIAGMLFFAALWIFTKFRNIGGAAAGGVLLAAAQLIRPDMYVALIGAALFYVFLAVKQKDKKIMRKCVVFVAAFAAVILVTDAAMVNSGFISGHVYDGNMKYKICVGLNPETKGGWSESDAELLNDSEKMDEVFKERVTNIGNIPLMLQKTIYQFGSYVYPWIMKTETNPGFSNMVCRRAVSAYMIIMSLLAAVILIRGKEQRAKLFPMFIILFGYMAVYSLIEIQPRYNFMMIPLITIIGSDIVVK